jgi:hypothetical protein
MNRIRPSPFWTWINVPMMALVSSAGSLQNTVVVPFFVAIVFQFYAFRYQKEWFMRYNYVFAAAVNASVAVCVICINLFELGVGTPENRSGMLNWQLNSKNGLDYYCKGLSWDSK